MFPSVLDDDDDDDDDDVVVVIEFETQETMEFIISNRLTVRLMFTTSLISNLNNWQSELSSLLNSLNGLKLLEWRNNLDGEDEDEDAGGDLERVGKRGGVVVVVAVAVAVAVAAIVGEEYLLARVLKEVIIRLFECEAKVNESSEPSIELSEKTPEENAQYIKVLGEIFSGNTPVKFNSKDSRKGSHTIRFGF